MQVPEHLQQAIDHFLSGTATDAEQQQVNEWYYSVDTQEVIVPDDGGLTPAVLFDRMKLRLDQAIIHHTQSLPTVRRATVSFLGWWRYAAAIILLLLGTGVYLFYYPTKEPAATASRGGASATAILPGGNRALLTLADGSTIVLDSTHIGNIAAQGSTRILKQDGHSLTYVLAGSGNNSPALSNTVSTPRGGEYQVVLPDGSRVWLNAESSITFPTAFTGSDRRVEATGEVYVEVAANSRQPFIVHTGAVDVRVLGTKFNINAYPNEAATLTTLIQGSVQVIKGTESLLLYPGEQAITVPGGQAMQKINTDDAVAWKNGRFEFHGNIQEIMRTLVRWYDIEVEYEGSVTSQAFAGSIARSETLREVLKMMEATRSIHFKQSGKRITVY